MADGRWLVFAAPVEGAFELWRVEIDGGRVERLTRDRHYLGRHRPRGAAAGRRARGRGRATSGTEVPNVVVGDVPAGRLAGTDRVALRPGQRPHGRGVARHPLVPPGRALARGRRTAHPGLVHPGAREHEAAARRRRSLEIHGGPATLYGWSLMWEWQVLAANGISVYACNPRGSQGYGQAFLTANVADWGDGPMDDVMGGLDALIADGLVDPDADSASPAARTAAT